MIFVLPSNYNSAYHLYTRGMYIWGRFLVTVLLKDLRTT